MDYDGNPIPAEDLPASRAIRTGVPVEAARLAVDLPEGRIFLRMHAAPLIDESGRPDGAALVVEDVSELVQAERQATRHASDLALLSETAMGFVEFPPEGDIFRYIGDKVCEIVGDLIVFVASLERTDNKFQVRYVSGLGAMTSRVAQLLGMDLIGLRVRAHPEVVQAMSRGCLTELDYGVYDITSGLIPRAVADAAQKLIGFGPIHVIGITRARGFWGTVSVLCPPGVAVPNVTLLETFVNQAAVALERRESDERARDAEERLIQSQKLEAIGTLAGGLAHDFNNLLSVVMASASLLRVKVGPGSDLARHAQMIETEAQRGSDLVKQLMGFARKERVHHAVVDVHAAVGEVIDMLEHTLDKRTHLVDQRGADRAVVTGDAGQLQQVLLNLAVNARDAMPDGGELRFATRVASVGDPSVSDHPELVSGEYLVVSVTDTGVGIPESVRDRVFEPFFTTKDPGSGTGMGLSTSYGIVRSHGGVLEVESELGRGSTFSLWLPLAAAGVEPDRQPISVVPPRGAGRVLVVDDEQSVCEVLTGMLEALGYQASAVHDGQQALDHYRVHGAATDLVILDIMMPVMGGQECLQELRKLDPEVRALVSSGHAASELSKQMIAAGARGCLSKPYNLHQLAEAVAEVLAS